LQARLARDLDSGVPRIVLDEDEREDEAVFVSCEPTPSETADRIARRVEDLKDRTRAMVIDLSGPTGLDGDTAASFADVIIELSRNPRESTTFTEGTRRLRVQNHADGSGASHVAASARSFSVPYDAAIAAVPAAAATRVLLSDGR